VVTGPTGSGKTTLTRNALQDLMKLQGGYYIRGSFDIRQHPDPYRAFIVAFTDYTQQVIGRGPEQIRKLQNAILRTCESSETNVLTEIIPSLTAIIEYKDTLGNEVLSKQGSSLPNDAIQRFILHFKNLSMQ
jgi:predicted ATPase